MNHFDDSEIAKVRVMKRENNLRHDLPLVYETRPRCFRDYAHRLRKLLKFRPYYRPFFSNFYGPFQDLFAR